jgi:hypothetical protein
VRRNRLITPSLRAALLIGIGSALFAGPFAIGLSLPAVVTGGAAAFFFVTAIVQLALSATTRYTAGPVAPSFLP